MVVNDIDLWLYHYQLEAILWTIGYGTAYHSRGFSSIYFTVNPGYKNISPKHR